MKMLCGSLMQRCKQCSESIEKTPGKNDISSLQVYTSTARQQYVFNINQTQSDLFHHLRSSMLGERADSNEMFSDREFKRNTVVCMHGEFSKQTWQNYYGLKFRRPIYFGCMFRMGLHAVLFIFSILCVYFLLCRIDERIVYMIGPLFKRKENIYASLFIHSFFHSYDRLKIERFTCFCL